VATPLVSIILPTQDRPQVLARAVASVCAQTEADFELIVVDNSNVAVNRLSRNSLPGLADPRVRIVRAEAARNAGGARNVGLDVAAAEWITFLDDDDAYRPTKIAAQLALAKQTGAPVIFCGALVHLHRRTRLRHTGAGQLSGDELLNATGFATPLILHRWVPGMRFDETLFAGEDMHYLQGLFAHFRLSTAQVVPEPLVDVYQDVVARERTNVRAEAGWRAARRTWWQFGRRYSPAARRLFVVRAMMTRAKLERRSSRVAALFPTLVRTGGMAELRFGLNALAVSTGWRRGRWVT
jgi:glycosyltransferase involved in cell wall biosynthesis